MVKITAPLLSLTAHGWLGGDMYMHRWYKDGVWHEPTGVVQNPYPIGAGQSIRYPYHMNAFGPRPYPAFISSYYSPRGWVYQRARTWHGCIIRAIRPPISVQPRTSAQTGNEVLFAEAVAEWQAMSQGQQDVYKKWRYPAKASGYNRFLSWYLRSHVAMPTYWGNLARSETDPTLIPEFAIEKANPQITYPFQFYNKMAMNMVVHKGPGFPDSPVQGQLFYRSDEDKVYAYDGAGWNEIGGGAPGGGAQEADVIVAGDGSGDYTDIQDGIDALPANGGYLFIKAGTYTLSAGLVVAKSNVRICGAGSATIITQGAAANLELMTLGDGASEYTNIILDGLTFDGNKADNTTGSAIVCLAKVTNPTIKNCIIHDVIYYGINGQANDRDGMVVENCTFEDVMRNCVDWNGNQAIIRHCSAINLTPDYSAYYQFTGGGVSTVDSCYFLGPNNADAALCVYTFYATMVNIYNCFSNGMQGLYGMYTYFNWPNSQQIIGNYVENSYRDAIWSPYQDSIVMDNIVYGCGGYGIYGLGNRTIISGNIVMFAGRDGIYLNAGNSHVINNRVFLTKGNSITLPYSFENLVQSNTVLYAGDGQVGRYSMIEMQGRAGVTCERNMIYDNMIYYGGSGYREHYAINEISPFCNYNLIRGNMIKGFFPVPIQVVGSGSDAWDNVQC